MDERRKSPRFDVDRPARLHADDAVIEGRLVDLCREAAFLEVDRLLPVGTAVRVEMELPGPAPLIVEGQVVRHGEGGVAVMFGPESPAAITRIDLFLDQHD
jgi:hypothetical protein